jgi:hypothetical protein
MNTVRLAGVLRDPPVFHETGRGRFSASALLDFGGQYGFQVQFFCLNAAAQQLQTFPQGQEVALTGRLVMSADGKLQILADSVVAFNHNQARDRTNILSDRSVVRHS